MSCTLFPTHLAITSILLAPELELLVTPPARPDCLRSEDL